MGLWSIWLIIGVILIIVEMLTFTFYLLWIGIGAMVAAAIAWIFPDAIMAQIIAGCIVALLLTYFTKPLTSRFRSAKGFKDAIDEMLGKQGVVLEAIEPGKLGIVKVGNETWSASSNEYLVEGEIVIVVERGNTIVEVQKWGGKL